ncbi:MULTISPECIES: rod shape-determining protein MreC [Thiorhodovibrio]|uniref:rod shape-determining protein MreC n=1 Tax=Thiorhodovibrio TaxID=61593 RepID=UPI001913FA63|nr:MULTISPECIES: rod shape-determining protein MreC [Thiorhodovibrio]MBK5971130.1 rod shape-determining protein MreC [Thiorhodovibrio winogradskyi]WPL10502.1 Rod shape-determining protein MreC [Thiorhodovibrio litoralis]
MKPLFNRGPSAGVRLVLALVLAFALIIADLHYRQFDALRSGLAVTVYPLQVLASLPTRFAQDLESQMASKVELRAENERLHRENLTLRARLQRFASLESENERLRNLLGSAFKVGERVLIAELLQVDLDPYRQQVLIDKGALSGVFVGQPVLDANAVMGQVVRTNPLTSTVLLITDARHSLPVKINRNGLRSIATGSGLVDQLNLLHLPKKADVRVGDLLVTSGLGGTYPPGYPVARVTEVRIEPGKRFATVTAEPTARLDRSHEVLLVWSLPKLMESGVMTETGGTGITSTLEP